MDNEIQHENAEQTLQVIVDNYEHWDSTLEYVLENVLQENEIDSEEYRELRENYNSVLINICQCTDSDACSDSSCAHGGNYNEIDNELVLRPDRGNDLIYECSSMCKCNKKNCKNRVLQNGPRLHLKIINSPRYGSKGLATTKDIPCGGFICEYAGELLTKGEARRRIVDNDSHSRMNYILCLYEISLRKMGTPLLSCDKISTIVDPSRRGNVGRYLNHSCQPNCQIYSVRVDCPLPRIGIFANRQIRAGEELSFNYGENTATSEASKARYNRQFFAKPCLCKSKNCKKFLPNVEFG